MGDSVEESGCARKSAVRSPKLTDNSSVTDKDCDGLSSTKE